MERWIGITVGGGAVTVVDAEVDPKGGPITIQFDKTFKLQQGTRSEAYRVMHDHIGDYVESNGVVRVIVKGSAVAKGGGLSHLESAELRGVVIAACAAKSHVIVKQKATVSKTFGNRKVDDYVKDDAFWTGKLLGINLKKGSREAALLILTELN